jgi:hypothetical protein
MRNWVTKDLWEFKFLYPERSKLSLCSITTPLSKQAFLGLGKQLHVESLGPALG